MQTRTLSVAEWRKMTQEGMNISVRIQLNGYSMQPLIRRLRDHVTIYPLKRNLKKGDIVLFADDTGRYVVHRVIRLTPDKVITQGDHCRQPDRPLDHEQVWGLVTKLERGGRVISLDCFISRMFGRFWTAILPIRIVYDKISGMPRKIYRRLKDR